MSTSPNPTRGRSVTSAPASERGQETRERLLDAAERLFAERGFDGASVRAVTQAAGTSVSAANYHFGSKEALLVATLQRRVQPVNTHRLERLDALEREAREASLSVERILDAFLRPLFEDRAARGMSSAEFRQVAARLYADPLDRVLTLKRELFGVVSERFVGALGRALPDLDSVEVALRFQFVVAALVHVMSGHLATDPGLERAGARAGARSLSEEDVLEALVAFSAAGLRVAGRGRL